MDPVAMPSLATVLTNDLVGMRLAGLHSILKHPVDVMLADILQLATQPGGIAYRELEPRTVILSVFESLKTETLLAGTK